MRVRLARTAGFCPGVRRALELALRARQGQSGPISTLGPLIHNPQVLELLRKKGIEQLGELPQRPARPGEVVIIRAHGVPAADKRLLKELGYRVVEGTCPRVVKVQAIIRRASRQGRDVVIVGDPRHSEVVGLLGHGRGRGHVVAEPREVADLPPLGEVVVVAQTTQDPAHFSRVVAELRRRFTVVEVRHTICEATHSRQDEVRRLAGQVQAMVVVGGRQSGNTRRLGAIAGQHGQPVFMVESDEELDLSRLAGLDEVGVSAGASTPNWMINQVVRRLEGLRTPSEARLGYWLRRAVRFLVRSQLVVAAGAGAMTLAGGLMQGFVTPWPLAAAAFCYFFAMHVMNNFLDREAQQYNDPDRVRFLAVHRPFLVAAAVLAAAAALFFSALAGWPLAIVTALMVGAGLLYTAPLVPASWRGRLGFAGLKDLPGSKTVSAAMAWGLMAALLPAWASGQVHPLATPLAFLFVMCLALVRYTIFDILDAQGDLIVGKETIPLVLGLARAERLMSWLLCASAVMLLAAVALGPAPHWALGLLLPVAGLWTMRLIQGRARATGGVLHEALVDAGFWLAGLVALAAPLLR